MHHQKRGKSILIFFPVPNKKYSYSSTGTEYDYSISDVYWIVFTSNFQLQTKIQYKPFCDMCQWNLINITLCANFHDCYEYGRWRLPQLNNLIVLYYRKVLYLHHDNLITSSLLSLAKVHYKLNAH